MNILEELRKIVEARKRVVKDDWDLDSRLKIEALCLSTDWAALLAHVEKLEAIVAALPKTEDGVTVTIGMNCAEINDEGVVDDIGVYGIEIDGDDVTFKIRNGDGREWDSLYIYSTREAAEAAQAKAVKP